MEETLATIDGSRSAAVNSFIHTGQGSFEELKQLLTCVSVELTSTREAAKAQSLMQEARVMHLEELYKTTCRERDEYREKFLQLQARVLSSSRSNGSGLSQEPQLRVLAGLQSLESTMSEPSRTILSEVHKRLQGQPSPLELQKQLEYVSSMNEPTRETLTELHRKMQEQQHQQQLELQQMGMQQHHVQRRVDLQHQRNGHSHELRPTSSSSHHDYPSQQQQQQQHHPHHHHDQLEELRQHLEIQHKDSMSEQQQQQHRMDIGDISDRQPGGEVAQQHCEVVDNGNDAKSTTWNDFPPGVHMEIHSPNEPCLILDSPDDHMHMKLTQGLPSPHVDQNSPNRLDNLRQLQQQHEDGDMQLHIHQQQQQHQQEPEQLLSHMQQQGQATDSRSLHMEDEQPLRRQLSKHRDGLTPISGSVQGANEAVINLSQLQQQQQQHSSWPVGLMGLSSSPPPPPLPLANGCPTGLPDQLLQSSCLQGGSVVASILSPLERLGDSPSSSLLLSRQVHLPEPPEADPQVMLNSLPEKGKLLQAVMQAGPLLQTLLLAGPLPQWRHPPPPLDAEEIPPVSMGATVGIMPPVEQAIGLMASHGSSLEQVMRLSTPVQSSPSQNGFCH